MERRGLNSSVTCGPLCSAPPIDPHPALSQSWEMVLGGWQTDLDAQVSPLLLESGEEGLGVMRVDGGSGVGGEGWKGHVYPRKKPPSEWMTWPVIQPASSLARKAIRRAASSGAPMRPCGNCGSSW